MWLCLVIFSEGDYLKNKTSVNFLAYSLGPNLNLKNL